MGYGGHLVCSHFMPAEYLHTCTHLCMSLNPSKRITFCNKYNRSNSFQKSFLKGKGAVTLTHWVTETWMISETSEYKLISKIHFFLLQISSHNQLPAEHYLYFSLSSISTKHNYYCMDCCCRVDSEMYKSTWVHVGYIFYGKQTWWWFYSSLIIRCYEKQTFASLHRYSVFGFSTHGCSISNKCFWREKKSV